MATLALAVVFLCTLSCSSGQLLQKFAKSSTFCMPTEPQMEGPYYVRNSPLINGTLCEHTGPSIFRLYLSGQIVSAEDCSTPVPAVLEAWQANEIGNYSQFQFGDSTNFDCRKTINTDKQGRFEFETTFPGRYNFSGLYRPAHIHFKITPLDSQYGGILTTQIYFEHDVYLGEFGQYSTVVLPLIHRNDLQSFETQWFVYIKKGGNGEWQGEGGPGGAGGPMGPPPQGQLLQKFAKPTSFCMPTEPQEEGPYYIRNSPLINGTLCEHTGPNIFRLYLSGQILSAEDCATPVPAVLEAWQANEIGNYSQFQFGDNTNFDCRKAINTDSQGRFEFETTFPGRYSLGGGYRPAHVHFKITPVNSQYGGILTTQIYFEDDRYLGEFGQYSTVVLPLIHRNDLQSFETQWFVYIKKGGNGEWQGGAGGPMGPMGPMGPPPQGGPMGPGQQTQMNQGQQQQTQQTPQQRQFQQQTQQPQQQQYQQYQQRPQQQQQQQQQQQNRQQGK